SISIGVLVSYWIDYGSNYIGGTRCAPHIPYTGGQYSSPAFNPYYHDVPKFGHCTGQSEASWRLPLALQIVPAHCWLLMKQKDDKSLAVLSKLRKQPHDSPLLLNEFLEIKGSIMLENTFVGENEKNLTGYRLHIARYILLFTKWARFKWLAIGYAVMFFQQFMGCNVESKWFHVFPTCHRGIWRCDLPQYTLCTVSDRQSRATSSAGAGTFITLAIVGGILGSYGALLTEHRSAGWAGIAFIYIYGFNFSYSFAPIGWVLPSEIFNLYIRSKAISITTSTTWMCNFPFYTPYWLRSCPNSIIGLVAPDMLDSITWGTYIFFAAFCLLALAFTYFCIPETRGRFGSHIWRYSRTRRKERIKEIKARLRGPHIADVEDDLMKPEDQHIETV
ncbi:hypothetical protein N7493_001755, partial [Penicillium malachiteum]